MRFGPGAEGLSYFGGALPVEGTSWWPGSVIMPVGEVDMSVEPGGVCVWPCCACAGVLGPPAVCGEVSQIGIPTAPAGGACANAALADRAKQAAMRGRAIMVGSCPARASGPTG